MATATVVQMPPAVPIPQAIGGFSLAGQAPTRKRLVISVAGLDKSGKTNLALTAPGPMAYANFDTGLEGVIHKFEGTKRIYREDYRVIVPPRQSVEQVAGIANEVWERYKSDVRMAHKSPLIRTIVIDTESETWELIRLARFGKLTQVMPHHYGPVNAEYRNFLNEVYDTDKNLVILGRLKDEWENTVNAQGKEVGHKTGRLERVGMKDIPYIVQLNAIAHFDPMTTPGDQFSLEIINCRQNSEMCGTVLPQSMCTFQSLAGMVYPNSQETDWT